MLSFHENVCAFNVLKTSFFLSYLEGISETEKEHEARCNYRDRRLRFHSVSERVLCFCFFFFLLLFTGFKLSRNSHTRISHLVVGVEVEKRRGCIKDI